MRSKRDAERGQVLLELLPVVVTMLVLIFGVVDFSRAIWQLQVISGLTREGSNLASRDTSLQDSAAAVVNDGAVLNLSGSGRVIITEVQNLGNSASPKFVMTGQYTTGSLPATSRVGTYDSKKGQGANKANIPATSASATIPPPGGTCYITEIYDSYKPITPLGAFLKGVVPSTLYDAAYF